MKPLMLISFLPAMAIAAQATFSAAAQAIFGLGEAPAGIPKPAKLSIVPEPLEYTFGDDLICIGEAFKITLSGELQGASADVHKAVDRAQKAVQGQTHQWLSVGRGAEFWLGHGQEGAGGFQPCTRYLDELQLSLTPASDDVQDNQRLTILGGATAPAPQRVKLEHYELRVPLEGPAKLKADAALGLLRGLTTFEHLFYRLDEGEYDKSQEVDSAEDVEVHGRVYAPFAPYEIRDQPAMGWRGLMLDTARNYLSVKAIRRTVDTMSMVKMTPLHWHITDSDSWPLDLPGHPEVARGGAYDRYKRYTAKQVQEVITYAGERGVDVVIEVDMPGHTASLALSHPEHVACFGWYWDDYAAKPPAGQLRFANQDTAMWARGYVEELVGSVRGSYVHTGGDEASKRCIDDDEPTQKALRDRNMTVNEAMNSFHAEIHAPIRAADKTPVVWQEAALDYGNMPSLRDDKEGGKTAIVHVWKDMDDIPTLLDKGFSVILAPGGTFYLDRGNGAWLDEPSDDISAYDPYMTWRHIMAFNPYANITTSQRSQTLGGQVQAWAEQTDEHNLDSQLWPRAAAASEVFWGGDREGAYPRDAREYARAMHDVRYRMVEKGTDAKPLAPHWCAVNPGMPKLSSRGRS